MHKHCGGLLLLSIILGHTGLLQVVVCKATVSMSVKYKRMKCMYGLHRPASCPHDLER